jgi:hypothetical protein
VLWPLDLLDCSLSINWIMKVSVLMALMVDPPSQMKFWTKSKWFPTCHKWLDELSLFA